MEPTRERCESRLRPLLQRGVIPVVTGFIGATQEGLRTTLGRGGSDYSATILGAALDADEVIIWTDVDGMMTADPRFVADATTIDEISYREATDLAQFGAKVLHPKAISPMTQYGIPVRIRNTFTPERPGTRITPQGSPANIGVKGLAAINDVALITVSGPGIALIPEVLERAVATAAAIGANAILASQSSHTNEICLVVTSSAAKNVLEGLRREFAQDLAHRRVENVALGQNAAVVTVVGKNMRGSEVEDRAVIALGKAGIHIIAIAQGSSESNISFVVRQQDVRSALEITHQEFQLGALDSRPLPVRRVDIAPPAWHYETEQRTASAD
jgi:aspartate kinase